MVQTKVVRDAFIWKLIEKIGTKGVQFIIQIFLARLLFPEDYGTVAILSIFIALANVFIQNGFSTSLIQKRRVDDTDYSTAFYGSFVIAVVFYGVLYLIAPVVATFYSMPLLKSLLRTLAVVLFAGSINSIQYAYVSRQLQFKGYSLANIGASVLSGILGVFCAQQGLGVWALVIQQITANYLAVIFLFCIVKWKPKLIFSWRSLIQLWDYGWKILCSSLINSLYSSLYNLIIGKVYNSNLLGLYSRGDQLPNLIANNVNETVQSISFPIMSTNQDNTEIVKTVMKKGLIINMFFMVPIMLGLAVTGRTVISVLFTERWLEAAPYMQMLCIIYMLYPVHTMNISCIKAVGRSDLFLKTEILKKCIEISLLGLTVQHGLMAMLCGQLVSSVLCIYINTWPTKRLINYGMAEQLNDISRTLVCGFIMVLAVWLVGYISLPKVWLLLVQIIAGIFTYGAMNLVVRNEGLIFCMEQLKEMRNG